MRMVEIGVTDRAVALVLKALKERVARPIPEPQLAMALQRALVQVLVPRGESPIPLS